MSEIKGRGHKLRKILNLDCLGLPKFLLYFNEAEIENSETAYHVCKKVTCDSN